MVLLAMARGIVSTPTSTRPLIGRPFSVIGARLVSACNPTGCFTTPRTTSHIPPFWPRRRIDTRRVGVTAVMALMVTGPSSRTTLPTVGAIITRERTCLVGMFAT